MRWEKVQANTRPLETPEGKKSPGRIGGILGPGRRWGHTCNSVKGGRFLYVFGGYGKDNCQTNDVHVFDTLKQTWSKPMVKGTPPSPRDSHSCTTVGNNLFVFGGTDGKYPLNDLHVLDTSTNTWIRPNLSGPLPAPREGHSAALVDKRLFIFGGCGKSCNDPEELYYNDLYILDTESFIWKLAVTSGRSPSARDSHTCSSWKNKIIVVGGEDSSDYYLSDAHVLDADSLVWTELQTSGHLLTPRAGHSAVALGKHLFVFGGFTDDRNLYDDLHVLNVETGVWNKVESAGGGPTARFSVAGDCLDPRKGILVFIGGCNQTLDALEDMYYLYTGVLVQNEEEEPRHEKYSLRRELKKKCQEQYLLPHNRSEHFKDFSKLEVMPPVTFASSDQEAKQHVQFVDLTPEKVFHAKVTDSFHYGYTIETTIDGKPLRGILFSCKAGFGQTANESLSRKRASPEDGNVKADESCEPKQKMIRLNGQEIKSSDQMQPLDAQGLESTSQGSPMETVVSDSNNSPLDVCQQEEIKGNSELSLAPAPTPIPAPAAASMPVRPSPAPPVPGQAPNPTPVPIPFPVQIPAPAPTPALVLMPMSTTATAPMSMSVLAPISMSGPGSMSTTSPVPMPTLSQAPMSMTAPAAMSMPAPAPALVSTPATAPVSLPATAPVSLPAAAPVSPPAPAPASPPSPAPASPPSPAPASPPAPAPASPPAPAPASPPAPMPASPPAPTPASPPAPLPVSRPSPVPVSVGTPVPVSAPSPVPVSMPGPELMSPPAPAPMFMPAPAPMSTPAPVPKSTPSPARLSSPSPVPMSTPAPVPVSTPAPVTMSMPSPAPMSTPSPVPMSTPAPVPMSMPAPVPMPTSPLTGSNSIPDELHMNEAGGPCPSLITAEDMNTSPGKQDESVAGVKENEHPNNGLLVKPV